MKDFDERIERRGTDSVKWDRRSRTKEGRDILPMWVADMDFAVPDPVIHAIRSRLDHPVFGYGTLTDRHRDAFMGWQKRRNDWELAREWMVFAPGVMPVVRAAILGFTDPGDEVVIQPPVYYPFFNAVRDNGRRVVENPLVESAGRYEMDLEHLESCITDRTRLFILCSPHNPVGRVWTRSELVALAELCCRRGLTIVSDEIHGDLIRSGNQFVPLAALSKEVADITVTCASPTKTFNIAGLASAFAVVPGSGLRRRLQEVITRLGMDHPNVLSLTAAAAAYSDAGDWLDSLLLYLSDTFDWFETECARRFDDITVTRIEGTYLAWLNIREPVQASATDAEAFHRILVEQAGLWLSAGTQFGTGGDGFMRMNLACPRSMIAEGLDRLESGLAALR